MKRLLIGLLIALTLLTGCDGQSECKKRVNAECTEFGADADTCAHMVDLTCNP